MGNTPHPLPSHPGQQPEQPANPSDPPDPPPPPPGNGGGDGDDDPPEGDGNDKGNGQPIDDPDRPPYIPLERWIEIRGLGLVLSTALRENQAPKRNKGTKPRDPDCYDGSDPSKLDDFFFQCGLVFEYYPDAYRTDSAKVLYAIQRLKDTAQRHFRNSFGLPKADKPDYYNSWEAFVKELQTNFGELDRSSSAVTQLLALKMQEHHKVIRYKVDFEELAGRTPWDNVSLRDLFYKGLAERIKDQIAASQTGKAASLAGLKNQALAFDTRYWERKNETSHGNKSSKNPSSNAESTSSSNLRAPATNANQSGSSQRNQPSSNQTPNRNPISHGSNTSSSSNANRNNPPSNSNRGTPAPNPSSKPPTNRPNPASKLEGKVDEQGKLTEAERQRRKAAGLCMYCEQKGHLVANCPARLAKEEAKARRATATPVEAPSAPKN